MIGFVSGTAADNQMTATAHSGDLRRSVSFIATHSGEARALDADARQECEHRQQNGRGAKPLTPMKRLHVSVAIWRPFVTTKARSDRLLGTPQKRQIGLRVDAAILV